jgi:hypothetical protein
VIPRLPLKILVYTFPLLIVTFAVLMGAQALSAATGDAAGAGVLRGLAIGTMVLLLVDMLLLLGLLGFESLTRHEDR